MIAEHHVDLFPRYDAAVQYELKDIASFQAIPSTLQPLFTVRQAFLADHIAVQASQEPFVQLTDIFNHHGLTFQSAIGTTAFGSTPNSVLWLRAQAAERLSRAAHRLQQLSANHYAFRITDAYRTLALQREHFEKIKQHLKVKGVTVAQLYQQATQLIADPDLQPPHATGGTVDVTLYDKITGQELNLGTPVDVTDTPLIHTWHSAITSEQRQLRALLYTVMTEAGFVNYPFEWWHYSYGDKEWALHAGHNSTLYDAVEELPESSLFQS